MGADWHLTVTAQAPRLATTGSSAGGRMGQRSLRPGVVAGVIISLTAAAAASRGSDSPLVAFVEVGSVGLLCTLLAVGVIAYGRRRGGGTR
jgi:hypothetical protein